MLGSACSIGSSKDEEAGPVPANEAARLFLRAGEKYRAQERLILDQAEGVAFEQRRACPLGVDGSDQALETRIFGVVLVFKDILRRKLAIEQHGRLARDLNEIPTDNEALRTVAASIMVLDKEFAKLKSADVDVCSVLQEWKRRGWSRAYEVRIGELAYDLKQLGLDTEALGAAGRKASGLQPTLQALGLTQDEAVSVSVLMIY